MDFLIENACFAIGAGILGVVVFGALLYFAPHIDKWRGLTPPDEKKPR